MQESESENIVYTSGQDLFSLADKAVLIQCRKKWKVTMNMKRNKYMIVRMQQKYAVFSSRFQFIFFSFCSFFYYVSHKDKRIKNIFSYIPFRKTICFVLLIFCSLIFKVSHHQERKLNLFIFTQEVGCSVNPFFVYLSVFDFCLF